MKTRLRIEDDYYHSYRKVPFHVGCIMALVGFALTIFTLVLFCAFIFIIVSGTFDLARLIR